MRHLLAKWTGLVYLSLGPAQQAQLLGGSGAWQVFRGRPDGGIQNCSLM
jgi:hypothetical protein